MNISYLEKLDLDTFEKACRVLFDQMGFNAKSIGSGSMSGVGDFMVLSSKSSNSPFALLQCAVSGARVELIQLVQVKNYMEKMNLSNGYLVTVETPGKPVQDFAAANKINLVDGVKFVELISKLSENGRNLLRETMASVKAPKAVGATNPVKPVEFTGPPTCSKCGSLMKLQVKQDGLYKTGKYWQCPQPGCGYICAYT